MERDPRELRQEVSDARAARREDYEMHEREMLRREREKERGRATPTTILATAGYDHTIRFWEASSGMCTKALNHPDSQVNKLELTPDKQYVAAAGNPHLRFFDVASNNAAPVTSFDGHTTNITAVGFQREGKWMYTGSEDSTIKLWDLRAPSCQREYLCTAPVNSVVLHPNQAELISGDQNGNIRIWDLTANACSRELVPDGEVPVRSLSVASDGSMIVASNNKGTAFIWRLGKQDTTTFEPLQKIEAHKAFILKCLLSPDVKSLATASADSTIKIWKADTTKEKVEFKLERTLTGHQRWVWDAAFSSDAHFLISASSDHTARLWDLKTGESLHSYTGHHKAVSAVCIADS